MISKTKVQILVAFLLMTLASAMVQAQQPLSRAANILLEEKEGVAVDFHGVVAESFWDHYAFLRDDSGTVMVTLNTSDPSMAGIQRGDLISVVGTTRTKGSLRTSVEAKEVKVLRRPVGQVDSTRAGDIAAVHARGQRGELVSVVGTVSRRYMDILEIEDKSGGIRVMLGGRHTNRQDLVEGKQVAVIGEVDLIVDRLKVINAYGVALIDQLPELKDSKAATKEAKPLGRALRGVKEGDAITVRGQALKFIGETTSDFLFDGQNVLGIDPEPGSNVTVTPGEEIVVQGTLGFVTYKGKEYPVVRNAKVFRDTKIESRRPR